MTQEEGHKTLHVSLTAQLLEIFLSGLEGGEASILLQKLS